MTQIRWFLAVLLSICAVAAQAQAPLKAYVFGNSLIHHLTDSDETTVPHWLAQFARQNNQGFELDGQWGFMRDFAAQGMRPKWRFQSVDRVQGGAHDVVMVNPANFIQHRAPDRRYQGDIPDRASPVSATLAVMDQTRAKRFVIYEGWSEMRSISRKFPPSRGKLAKYYRHNQRVYHQWYETYRDMLQEARPDRQVELIPVASVLTEMLGQGVLQDLTAQDVFSDDAPHGTATMYFLAGAVTYVGLFQTALPEQMDLPDSLHPKVRSRWALIRETIHAQFDLKPQPQAKAVPDDFAPVQGLENPSLAMGLRELADWSPQQPFVDRMKMARTWVGHLPGRWGGRDTAELQAAGVLDAQGWPLRVPSDLRAVEALLLTDQPEAASGLAGQYRVRYDGQGDLRVTGRGRELRRAPGEIWFAYTPGDGPVGIEIRATQAGDHLRNISVVHERHIALFEAGALFNPDWIAHVQDLRLVRFMDWMMTNGSEISRWDQRPRLQDYTYTWRGAPIAVMLALANQIAADPWVTLPHQADDDYVRRFAQEVQQGLDPERRVFVEYSNELWNFSFTQTHWAREQAMARWGADAPGDAWIQFAGLRAAEVADIWGAVFGDEAPARLRRVVATHTGWKGLEQAMLTAPLQRGGRLPVEAFDAYAVTGYFGLELGNGDGAKQVLSWLDEARKMARAKGQALGYKRAKLDTYIAENTYQAVIPKAIDALQNGSVRELTQEIFPYHAEIARKAGLQLLMYEGGTHVVGLADYINNDELTDFFVTLNYSDAMAGLYRDVLAGWQAAGGSLFNAFVDVGTPSKWGSWGALRYLEDDNPRHRVLMAFSRDVPGWWDNRPKGSFQHGGIFQGSAGRDHITGSTGRDILFGGAGDDVIVVAGHGDLIHGGAGHDRAILPGKMSDYRFQRQGARLLAQSGAHQVSLFAIEEVVFAANPTDVRPVAQLF